MRIKILLVLLFAHGAYVHAQNRDQVTHLRGTEQVGNNEITVIGSGDRPFTTHFNGVSPFQIGNKNRVNGYDFNFSEPVKSVQIHIAGVNKGELIEFSVNGRKYNLFENNITPYIYEGINYAMPVVENGVITSTNIDASSATITIAPGYDINSLSVHHLNGKSGGVAFDLLIESGSTFDKQHLNATASIEGGTVLNSTHSLQLYPNPNNGSFTLKGNGYKSSKIELQIVNVFGQIVYEQQVLTNHQNISESISLAKSLPSGMYTLYLIDGDDKDRVRFTLSK